MKEHIKNRVLEVAAYVIETKSTVRQAAEKFGVGKSTIHNDITERLSKVNPSMAKEAREVLNLNKSERHIRGGNAIRNRYRKESGV